MVSKRWGLDQKPYAGKSRNEESFQRRLEYRLFEDLGLHEICEASEDYGLV